MNGTVKTVGKRNRIGNPDAVDSHRRALVLMRQLEKLNPNPKLQGFVFKARPMGLRAGIDPASLNKLADDIDTDGVMEKAQRKARA